MENDLKKLKIFDLGYFIWKVYFDKDGAQSYFVFQPKLEYFTFKSNWITKWKSIGLSKDSLEVVSTSDNNLTPSVNYYKDKVRLRFTESVLQQKTFPYSHKKIVKIYRVHEIITFYGIYNYPILASTLFTVAKLTENPEIYKYKYFAKGVGFDGHNLFFHNLIVEL